MAEIAEIKRLLEEQKTAFEEFKKTNDEIIAKKAAGESVTELSAKLDKITEDMDDQRKQFLELEKRANREALGNPDQLTDEQKAHKDAFNAFLRKGSTTELQSISTKAMSSGSDPDGGWLILPEMDTEIERVAPTISAMHRLASVSTIGTSKWQKRVKKSGMAMRRVADGSGGGESANPTYALIEIEAHTAEVEPWVHNETLEDAFVNLEMDLADEAAIGFAEGGGAEFISGDGVGKSRGILAYDTVANASYEWGKVGYVASGASGAFASSNPGDQIINLQHALKAQYRAGAVFLANDSTLASIRQMKDGSGNFYLWQPDVTGNFGGRLLGHTVEVDDNMPDIGAGSLSLAFGNIGRAYKIVNRNGITLIRDNLTTKGQTKFNFRKRFGGGIYNFEALKVMKFAAN